MQLIKDLMLYRLFLPVYSAIACRLTVKQALDNISYTLFFKRALQLLLLTSCVSFKSYAAQTDDNSTLNQAATIDFVKGYAIVVQKSDSTASVFAKRGLGIAEKDLIVTGENGFVSVSFNTGTVVNIQPSSEVIFDKINCPSTDTQCTVELNAISGSVNSDVKNINSNDVNFTITTPYATAAVRGTVFDIDISNSHLLAGVTEGRLQISSISGQIELPENYGTKVEQDQPPSDPKPLLQAPIFTSKIPRYFGADELTWDRVNLANQYIVAFNDATGLVNRRFLTDTIQPLEELSVGTYTAVVRAVDDDGFKGNTASKTFDIVRTEKKLRGPSLTSVVDADSYSLALLNRKNASKKIELIFSPTRNFEQFVSLDISPNEVVGGVRPTNTIYITARGIVSNTTVTRFGPIIEIPGR